MNCHLCQFEADIPTLKNHYQNFHLINPNEENFINLFKPTYPLDRKCEKCQLIFFDNESKKQHMFLRHYMQLGGLRNHNLNILHRGQITYYSINFN